MTIMRPPWYACRVPRSLKSSPKRRQKAQDGNALGALLREERLLAFSLATTAFFALSGERIYDRLDQPLWLAIVFIWLFGAVMASALAVVRHADHIAEILGEPYGTLVLTLSVTAIEVMSITAVMLHGENNPTLVRDTLFAIVMIIMGGMVGLSLLAGGWRHSEQHYNLQSANTYLSVIIPLALLTLSLPNFTVTTPGPTLSIAQQAFLVVISVGLYCFRHRPAGIAAISWTRKRPKSRRRVRKAGAGLPGMVRCSSPTSCRWCYWPSSWRIRSTI